MQNHRGTEGCIRCFLVSRNRAVVAADSISRIDGQNLGKRNASEAVRRH